MPKPKQTDYPMTAKERFIRQHAAARGLRLTQILARAKCARSVFYRVVRGTATSARIDKVIARALGLSVAEYTALRVSRDPTLPRPAGEYRGPCPTPAELHVTDTPAG
jgi:hypothetical protein